MSRFFAAVACAALLLNGCGQSPAPAPAPGPQAKPSPEAHGPDHEHAPGPHGGTIADWGGGAYHLEFVVDHGRQEANVYILGGDEKTPAPIKAEKLQLALDDPMADIELVARPLKGETDGLSSHFVGIDEALGKEQEFSGTISAEVGGTPYTGTFKQEHHQEELK